jgi:ABC-type transporter Mla subunit MlaD
MAEQDTPRSDPLGDVINLLAAPIAGSIRSYEQFRRGVDELYRTIENLNATMENLNEAAARLNRFMADVEEPVRAMLPQITRTVRAADEMMELVGGPAKKIAPNMARIADTLGSPNFATLPGQLDEFLRVMADMSQRLAPLTQFAESAGGLFGMRLPGTSRPAAPPAPPAATAPATPPARPAKTSGAPAKKKALATRTTTTRKKQPARKRSVSD